MRDLETYRKYTLYNKLLDTFTLLIVFILFTSLFYFLYNTTKSFIIIFVVMILIYIIALFIAKLLEIKIVMPSILYVFISGLLLIFIAYNEKNLNSEDALKGLLILAVALAGIFFVIALYKYETPVAIYFKVKDYLSGNSYGKKVKKRKIYNIKTNTTYANNLLFEQKKLINKLEEDYHYEYVRIDREYNLLINKKQVEDCKLKDLENKIKGIEKKLLNKNSGAQDYELSIQLKETKDKIISQKEVLVTLNTDVKNKDNEKKQLKTMYENEIYYISSAYNMRYRNYIDKIEDKLINTNIKLDIIPFKKEFLDIEGE